MLAPQRRERQCALAVMAAQPALLQAVRQLRLGQLARHVVAAFGPIQAAVGHAGTCAEVQAYMKQGKRRRTLGYVASLSTSEPAVGYYPATLEKSGL